MNIAGEIETQNLSINYKNAKKKKTQLLWMIFNHIRVWELEDK